MEWISVKDRLPDEEGEYLVYNDCSPKPNAMGLVWAVHSPSRVELGYYISNSHYNHFEIEFDKKADRVTHWMPLPQPPKDTHDS